LREEVGTPNATNKGIIHFPVANECTVHIYHTEEDKPAWIVLVTAGTHAENAQEVKKAYDRL
jgi:hypothetical protein